MIKFLFFINKKLNILTKQKIKTKIISKKLKIMINFNFHIKN